MPAPQQSSVPTYKETSNIRADNTAYFTHNERDSAGHSLARLLGVVPEAIKAHEKVQETDKPGPNEQEQLLALAQMGAKRDRLKIAKGSTVFGLLKGQETTMDTYQLERGRRQADLYAGQLKDAYAKAELFANDDPAAFAAFVEQQRNQIFNDVLKGADPAFHHGFVTRVGPVFAEMAQAHAGNLDGFVEAQNKAAFQTRLQSRVDLDLTVRRERDAFGTFMDSIMGAESGGNYNAFHGNGDNRQIRFTDMTIGEVLEWQKSGQWKQFGAESSAVGKYQFIHDTLKEVVRSAGVSLDTKFTPAVQDKLIFHRLANARGMKDYLEGRISAEEFLDSGLALEFAGLKKTNGKGHYDGDGVNKASLSSRKTLAALIEFKNAYLQDPASVSKANASGGITIDEADTRPNVDSLGGFLETVEEEFGVPQVHARTAVAHLLIQKMEADPDFADNEDLWDIMAEAKLNKSDRARVIAARDRVREEKTQRIDLADRKATEAIVLDADKFVRTGDEEALQAVREKNPQVYGRLLERTSASEDPETVDNEGFLAGADYSDPSFGQKAMKAFVDGEIDRETYTQAAETFEIRQTAKPILRTSGVKETVDMLKNSLPGDALKGIFEAQLSTQIVDMTKANDGQRPSLVEINEVAQQIHQSVMALHQQDVQQRMARPEYNTPTG